MPQTFVLPRQRELDEDANPMAGALLYFYRTNTTTPQAVYSDAALTILHSHPVVADASGSWPKVYLDSAAGFNYRVRIATAAGVQIYQEDDIDRFTVTQTEIAAALYPQTAAEQAAGVSVVNALYPPGNVLRYGTNTTPGTTDMTVAIQAAHNQGAQSSGVRPYLPTGSYLITTAINPCVLGMYGDGAKFSKIICNACNAFTIPSNAGWDRPQVVFELFGIDSNNGTSCDSNWAFYFGGVASGAAAAYNSGFVARDLAIGRNGRMGGGFYLKDVFGANVDEVICTHVSRMIQIVGSVVQSTFYRVRSFNDGAGTALSQYGISTETATYSGATTLTPENLHFVDCSYIRGVRGINHTAGFVITFENFDTEADEYGALLGANCEIRDGILAPGSGATAWVGIFRTSGIADADDGTIIDGVDINCLRAPGTPASSYGIDAGDGVSPVNGLIIRNCRVRGIANSLESAFRGRILADCTFHDNLIRTSVVTGTNDVNVTGERLFFSRNRNASGVWSISDAGSSSAYGEVMHNQITTLTSTFTTRANWRVDVNEAIIRRRRGVANIADGGTIAHGLSSTPGYYQVSATTSGEFASVTSVDGTNLTVAIKTHANGAGTTQNIAWEAEY